MTQVLSASCQELAGSSLPVTQLGLQYGSYKVVRVTLPSHCSLYFSSMPFLDPQFPSPAPPLFPYPPFSSPHLLFPAPSAPSPPLPQVTHFVRVYNQAHTGAAAGTSGAEAAEDKQVGAGGRGGCERAALI